MVKSRAVFFSPPPSSLQEAFSHPVILAIEIAIFLYFNPLLLSFVQSMGHYLPGSETEIFSSKIRGLFITAPRLRSPNSLLHPILSIPREIA